MEVAAVLSQQISWFFNCGKVYSGKRRHFDIIDSNHGDFLWNFKTMFCRYSSTPSARLSLLAKKAVGLSLVVIIIFAA